LNSRTEVLALAGDRFNRAAVFASGDHGGGAVLDPLGAAAHGSGVWDARHFSKRLKKAATRNLAAMTERALLGPRHDELVARTAGAKRNLGYDRQSGVQVAEEFGPKISAARRGIEHEVVVLDRVPR